MADGRASSLASGILKNLPEPRVIFKPWFKPFSRNPPPHPALATRDLASAVVPPTILRQEHILRRKLGHDLAEREKTTISLVDGSIAKLQPITRVAPQRQPKLQEKLDRQAEIRVKRWQDRMKNDVIRILAGPLIRDPIVKHPSWKISRIDNSPDLRHCYIYWSIEDPAERNVFKEAINTGLSKVTPLLRRLLDQQKTRAGETAKFSPELVFVYDSQQDAVDLSEQPID